MTVVEAMPAAEIEVLPAAEDLCSIRDACVFLSVSRRTVYNWMAHGKLRWWETPGGTRRILRRDLLTHRHAGDV